MIEANIVIKNEKKFIVKSPDLEKLKNDDAGYRDLM